LLFTVGCEIVTSVIPVTCPKVFVVICGTFVALPLLVYAVCVVRAFCLAFHVDFSVLVTNLLVVELSDMSSAVRVTAHVLVFTLVTASVGVANFFQLAAVEYGSALKIYVSLVHVTIAISHFSASDSPVNPLTADTVKVSVIAIDGSNPESIFQLASSTGIVQLVVQTFLLAAVHKSDF
jgi:hypothetical protein